MNAPDICPHDTAAQQIIKLMQDLDDLIIALRAAVPAAQPWQRLLRTLLVEADREMQVLRMTEACKRPDAEIAEAATMLGGTCRRVSLAVQGSRADAYVRSAAKTVGKIGSELSKLVLQETLAAAEVHVGALVAGTSARH